MQIYGTLQWAWMLDVMNTSLCDLTWYLKILGYICSFFISCWCLNKMGKEPGNVLLCSEFTCGSSGVEDRLECLQKTLSKRELTDLGLQSGYGLGDWPEGRFSKAERSGRKDHGLQCVTAVGVLAGEGRKGPELWYRRLWAESHREHLFLMNIWTLEKLTDPFCLNNTAICPWVVCPSFVAGKVMLSGQVEPGHATEGNLLL